MSDMSPITLDGMYCAQLTMGKQPILSFKDLKTFLCEALILTTVIVLQA